MVKVLLVDDEPDIELLATQKFHKQIASGTFDLLFAQNGREALDMIKQDPEIAVVVSDVNMPEMDGLTLLDKLKEINPCVKTIVVSAYGDTKTLRAAMNKGAVDFAIKPIDFNDLGESIQRTLTQYPRLVSPLYAYQLLLAATFPSQIDLIYPPTEHAVLWDAFMMNPQEMVMMGVSCQTSPVPDEISISTAHGLLKSNLSGFDGFEEKLALIHPVLKAHILMGYYHLETKVFSLKTNDGFKVHHLTSQGKTLLSPSQTAHLDLGDEVTLEHEGTSSQISLSQEF